jgi:hypothetical protein
LAHEYRTCCTGCGHEQSYISYGQALDAADVQDVVTDCIALARKLNVKLNGIKAITPPRPDHSAMHSGGVATEPRKRRKDSQAESKAKRCKCVDLEAEDEDATGAEEDEEEDSPEVAKEMETNFIGPQPKDGVLIIRNAKADE